jgi:hypothetical protein
VLRSPDDPDLRVGWISARHRADPCKTELIGEARRVAATRSTFRVWPWATIPYARTRGSFSESIAVCSAALMTRIFVAAGSVLAIGQTPAKPGSSGKLAVPPQHAHRFACGLGRQFLTHEPTAATPNASPWLRTPDAPDLRDDWISARHRADPCKTGPIETVRRATTTRSTCLIGCLR